MGRIVPCYLVVNILFKSLYIKNSIFEYRENIKIYYYHIMIGRTINWLLSWVRSAPKEEEKTETATEAPKEEKKDEKEEKQLSEEMSN